jgi:peptide-methionine (R)-S-oxide reductase
VNQIIIVRTTHPEPDEMPQDRDDWRDKLTPEQYRVTREGGTERPFSGQYYHHHERGVYQCVCCHADLFTSTEKYDSGSGWPSYWAPVSEQAITRLADHSHGMTRVEVRCARCGAHLGHVFEDGPPPSGLRYCINSLALDFAPARDATP